MTSEADMETVARNIYSLMVRGTEYEFVPRDEAFRRPRYQHLRERAMQLAALATTAARARIRAEAMRDAIKHACAVQRHSREDAADNLRTIIQDLEAMANYRRGEGRRGAPDMSEKWRREQKKCTPGTMFYSAEPEIDWKAAREWAIDTPNGNGARALLAAIDLLKKYGRHLDHCQIGAWEIEKQKCTCGFAAAEEAKAAGAKG